MDIFLEAYEALKDVLEAEDSGKPSQLATRAAFRASASADELGDNLKYGRIPASDADKVSDAHKAAHDKHMEAAKANRQSNQISTAQSHASLAANHGKLAAHYHTLHQATGSAPKKAVGEMLMLPTSYPTLLECSCEDKISPDEIDGTDDEFNVDERGMPSALRNYMKKTKKKK